MKFTAYIQVLKPNNPESFMLFYGIKVNKFCSF